jgi:hypothetical protein
MAYDIHQYVGEYKIRVGSLNVVGPVFEIDDKFFVGTGTHNDPPPQGDKVGVSIYSPDGMTQKFPAPGDPDAWFEMVSGNLVYFITDRTTLDVYQIQFTLVEVPEPSMTTFRTIYGAVIMLDPDVVGVWGADDQIP